MLELNERGYVKQRESQTLEFKQNFRFGDSVIEYARTMAAMANNRGGRIIFGVRNKPHEPIGLSDDRIDKFDPKDLNQVFLNYFSSDVEWKLDTFEQFGKRFGRITVEEAQTKPIVCARNHGKKNLREGAIYFRYRGQTKEIRYRELDALLQAERDKEKLLWMKHIQSIAAIGPQYVQVVDALKGEMDVGDAKVLIDSGLVSKLKLVKEGQFTEKDGAPTLRLIGDIEGLVSRDHVVYTETAYPHTQSSIIEKLPINSFEFQALLWKFSIKGEPRYHAKIKTGKNSHVHKYSNKLLSLFRERLRRIPNLVQKTRKEYSDYRCKIRR